MEGPAIARKLLEPFSSSSSFTDRVCWLIGHHHTYTGIDGPDYQILLEADFLVNAYEDQLDADAIRTFRDKVFRTGSGISLLNTHFDI